MFNIFLIKLYFIINYLNIHVEPPGGRGNLRIVPSVSLHAVKGSEWIM